MSVTWRRLLVGGGLLALVVLAVLLSPEAVISRVRTILFSPWFPVVLLGLYALRPFLGWPITVLSGLVGFRYGVMLGVPIALVGAIATSLVPYAAGRYFDPGGPILGRLADGSRRYFRTAGDLRGVVAARLAPTPAEPVSAAAGVGGVPLWAFVLGTAIGELPWTIAAVTVGHSLGAYSTAAIGVDLRLAIVGLVAALVLLAGPVYTAVSQNPSE